MVLIVVVGFGTWPTLKKEIFPETSVDALTVAVPFPNATPEEVEKGRAEARRIAAAEGRQRYRPAQAAVLGARLGRGQPCARRHPDGGDASDRRVGLADFSRIEIVP